MLVVDANSGFVAALLAGMLWDALGPAVRAQVERRRENKIVQLPVAERERWAAACKPVVDSWISAMQARNIDGAALLADARRLIQKHGGADS